MWPFINMMNPDQENIKNAPNREGGPNLEPNAIPMGKPGQSEGSMADKPGSSGMTSLHIGGQNAVTTAKESTTQSRTNESRQSEGSQASTSGSTGTVPLRQTSSATMPKALTPRQSGSTRVSAPRSHESGSAPQRPSSSRSTEPRQRDPRSTQGSSSENQRKKLGASLLAYRERRAAYRLIKRLEGKPIEEMEEKDRASLAWATECLKKYEKRKAESPSASSAGNNSQQGMAGKRQRSQDVTHPVPKRTRREPPSRSRPALNGPFNEVVKDHLIWAVIDRSNPEGAISPSNWKMVERALIKTFMKVLGENPGPVPHCIDAGWYQGCVKLIACDDKRSADLYKIAISRVGKLWEGARLEAVAREDIPCRPRASFRIPDESSTPREIMEIIAASNPQMNTEDWKVAKVEKPEKGYRQVVLIINAESLKNIAGKQGQIQYGFGDVAVRLYKKDVKNALEAAQRANQEPSLADREGSTPMDSPPASQGGSEVSETTALIQNLAAGREEPLLSVDDLDLTLIEAEDNLLACDEGGPDKSSS